MKYKINRIEQEPEFRPFEITIRIDTREEFIHFHNNVAGNCDWSIQPQFP